MKESDFLSFKRELWEIIRAEGIVVTNQNIDWLLERTFKELDFAKCAKSNPIRFVKFFILTDLSGNRIDIENDINNYARENHLIIVSLYKEHFGYVVLFEKGEP